MSGGLSGVGAKDAWYLTSLETEHSLLFDIPLVGDNSVAGSLGTPHRHQCGIPQGCPFSMVFISLYLRAWVKQMISVHAEPRTLADDILLMTR
eukprot:11833097-Karenia_brevis.AAC.1